MPAEAWQPYRREYPSPFGPGTVPRFHAGSYLIRHKGGHYRRTFPRARYVAHRADGDTFQRVEVQHALAAIAPGYIEHILTPLGSACRD